MAYQMTCILDNTGTLNISRKEIRVANDYELPQSIVLAPVRSTPHGPNEIKTHYAPHQLIQTIPFDPNDDIVFAANGPLYNISTCSCVNTNTAPYAGNHACLVFQTYNIRTRQFTTGCNPDGCNNCELKTERTYGARLVIDPLNESTTGASIAITNIRFIN